MRTGGASNEEAGWRTEDGEMDAVVKEKVGRVGWVVSHGGERQNAERTLHHTEFGGRALGRHRQSRGEWQGMVMLHSASAYFWTPSAALRRRPALKSLDKKSPSLRASLPSVGWWMM